MVWAQDCYLSRNQALWRCACKLLCCARENVHRVCLTVHTAEVRIPVVVPAAKDATLRQLDALDWSAFDDAITQCPVLEGVDFEVRNGDAGEVTERWLRDEVCEVARGHMSQKAFSVVQIQ